MDKKVILLLSVIFVLIQQFAFSQVTIPWQETFATSNFESTGFQQELVSEFAVSWRITNESVSAINGDYDANNYAILNKYSNGIDTTILKTPTFLKPTNCDTLALSFVYANPVWGSDFDIFEVRYCSENNQQVLSTINQAHENWTRMLIKLPAEMLDEEFQIHFYGITRYGYGVLLDFIKLEEHNSGLPAIYENSEFVQIGFNEQSSRKIPIDWEYSYNFSQQIFTKEELGEQVRTFYSIAFENNALNSETRNLNIYLAQTDKTSFNSSSDWQTSANLQLVFSGEVFVRNGWNTIVFNQPFNYDGTQNLLLVVDDNTGSQSTAPLTFASFYKQTGAAISTSDNASDILPQTPPTNGTTNSNVNVVRFGLINLIPDIAETENYLQIGTSSISDILPFDYEKSHCYTQQIFTANELVNSRIINSLAINQLTNYSEEREISVYLAHTSKEYFTNNSDWVNYSDLLKVYSGNISLSQGWCEIIFDYAFHYNGVDNLVVAIIDNNASPINSGVSIECSENIKTRTLRYTSNSQLSIFNSSTGEISQNRANIRLSFVSAHNAPIADIYDGSMTFFNAINLDTRALPINTACNYSASQQIFTAEELGGERLFNSVAFYVPELITNQTRTISIYLSDNNYEQFQNTYDFWLPWETHFSGTVELHQGWNEFPLSQPFRYDGSNNLILTVYDHTGTKNEAIKFATSELHTTKTIMQFSNTEIGNYQAETAITGARNAVKLGFITLQETAPTITTDEYIEIGMSMESNSGQPYGSSLYNYSQQLFFAEELGNQAQTIKSLSLRTTNYMDVRDVEIYIGHTSKTEFASEPTIEEWQAISDMQIVYSGDFAFIPNRWNTVNFDNDFDYNGEQNIIIAIYDKSNKFNYVYFHTTELNRNVSLSANSSMYEIDITNIDILPTSSRKRTDIRLGLVEYVAMLDTIHTNDYLQVGTDTVDCSIFQITPYDPYSVTQQIFTKEEMGEGRAIYSLSFKQKNNSSVIKRKAISIKIAETEKCVFDSVSDWISTNNFTEVFAGTVEFPRQAEWVEIILDRPFYYTGNSNLVVMICDTAGNSFTSYLDGSYTDKYQFIQRYFYDAPQNDDYGQFSFCNSDYLRSNIRFGFVEIDRYNVQVLPNDINKGTTSGTQFCRAGEGITISATPKFGFAFDKWADGSRDNPRYVVPTSDTTFIANFINTDSDTVNYCNDNYYNVVGASNGNELKWGIMIPAANLSNRTTLTDILIYTNGNNNNSGTIQIEVLQGVDTIPTQMLTNLSYLIGAEMDGWRGYSDFYYGELAISISPDLPLWIVLSSSDIDFPAAISTANNNQLQNGMWINNDGNWTQQTFGAWMIKAVLPIENGGTTYNELETVTNVSIFPNPASNYIEINGLTLGEEIKIYNILGEFVTSLQYDASKIDLSNFANGMYIIKTCSGNLKFVKE